MIYRFALWLISYAFLVSVQAVSAQSKPAQPVPSSSSNDEVYVRGELFVKTRPHLAEDEISSLIQAHGGQIVEKNSKEGFYRVWIADQVEKTAFSLQLSSAVLSARPNYILAGLKGEFITLYDMELMIQRMLPAVRSRFTDLPVKQELLRTMFEDKLILFAAKDESLGQDPDVQKEINETIDRVLVNAYKRKMRATGVISEKQLHEFYEENIEKYEQPEQIRGQLILLKTREEAKEVLELVKAGTDFGQLAKERSIDPTKENDGVFGWIRREQMPTDIGDAMFSLSNGEFTDIITTPSGFYIMKLIEKVEATRLTYSEAQDRIQQDAEMNMANEVERTRIRELEKRYQGRLHPEFLSELEIVVTPEEINASLPQMREAINSALETPYRYYPVDYRRVNKE